MVFEKVFTFLSTDFVDKVVEALLVYKITRTFASKGIKSLSKESIDKCKINFNENIHKQWRE